MNNLIIKLNGGTGNQIFQIAAAASISKINKKSCFFTAQDISNNKYQRKLEVINLLNYMGIKENCNKEIKKIICLDQYDIDHPLYLSENSPIKFFKSDIYLQGYFMNYRIHDSDVINKIKKYIQSLKVTEIFKNLDYIAIHLRELHGSGSKFVKKGIDNLQIDYYDRALNQIKNISNNSEIKNAVLFSDMWQTPGNSKLIPEIKKLLNKYNFHYFDGDYHINSPLDIINIFSLSKSCIISNSSLSWWGAYLCEGNIYSPVMSLWEPDLKIPDNWNQVYADEIMPKTHHNKRIFYNLIPKNEEISLKIYNLRRLKLIRIFRKLSVKLSCFIKYSKFIRWTKSLGFLPENNWKTFF